MDAVRSVTALPPIAAADSSARFTDTAVRSTEDRALNPAVSLDISPEAAERRKADTDRSGFERDLDSQAMVYRVTDTVSGDVIMQIPNEIIVKARVYGREHNPPMGERLERRA